MILNLTIDIPSGTHDGETVATYVVDMFNLANAPTPYAPDPGIGLARLTEAKVLVP